MGLSCKWLVAGKCRAVILWLSAAVVGGSLWPGGWDKAGVHKTTNDHHVLAENLDTFNLEGSWFETGKR